MCASSGAPKAHGAGAPRDTNHAIFFVISERKKCREMSTSDCVPTLSIGTLKWYFNQPTANILLPKKQTEVTKIINSKATHFKDRIELWVPHEPYTKIEDGYELTTKIHSNKLKSKSEAEKISQELNQTARSIRRTKHNLRLLAEFNDFDWFVTFTFKQDRHDDQKVLTRFQNWLHNVRNQKGEFRSLIVQERHKSGALHFHGLIGDYPIEPTKARTPNGRLVRDKSGRQVYNFPNYKLGHQTHTKIHDKTRVSRYITKYITKDLVSTNRGKKRYWASKNLQFPPVFENPEWCNKFAQNCSPENVYENKFGKLYTLTTQEYQSLISP